MTPPIDDEPERGAAMLIAMVFGSLAALMILVLIGRVVTEQRAVARSLAETRAYWAAQGISNYVLSRTMQMGNCGAAGNCGNASILALQQGYAAEIADLQTWQYPDVSAAYQFKLASTVSRDAVANAQEMLIRTTFAPPALAKGIAVPEALTSMASIRPLEFRYCLVATSTSPCASGLTKTLPGIQLVTSVHRPMN
ncbi:MAG: hypothetical protein ACRYG6_15650 [Janthinobacterium lividum]